MVSINTNLQSLILQNNLNKSTNSVNQAIERMSTGFKLNHSSDNAANYSIVSSMNSKLDSLEVASDNVAMGADLISTATENLDLVNSHMTRIRDLLEQSANGTYSESSRKAIQSEVDSRLNEINRIVANCEYNGIQIFNSGILPSAAKVNLTEFGMESGSVDFNVNGENYTVNVTEDDTLFSLMTKMESIGIKSDFDEKTGSFSIQLNESDVTDNGTGFKEILGISDTDGYTTDVLEEDVEKTRVEVATLDTRLDTLGITNGNFTIVNSDGTQTNDSISVTETIQQFFNKLQTSYGITGTLDENGVISLETEDNYIKGSLANQLGISYTESTYNEYEGKTVNTSNTLSKTVTTTANGGNSLAELGVEIGDTIEIRDNDEEVIWSKTADAAFLATDLDSLFSTLTSNGMTSASISNGIISLSSDSNNYVTGTIATKFGIGVNTINTQSTASHTQTSSSAVTYSVTSIADGTTTFADLNISTSNPVTVYNSNGTQIGTVTMTQNSTLATFINSINSLTTEGNATLTNGVISIGSGYITGDIATAMGIGYEVTGDSAEAGFVNEVDQITNFSDISLDNLRKLHRAGQITNLNGATHVDSTATYTVVGTASDLQTALNNNQNVILSNDINLNGFNWSIVNGYSSSFDGNGHVISNLNITTDEQYAGLFGSVASGATISNIGLENVTVTSSYTTSGSATGGLVGYTAFSSINNCYVSNAKVEYTGSSQLACVGGIIGYSAAASINNSNVYNVTLSAGGKYAYVGGIAGRSSSSITNSNVYNTTMNATQGYEASVGGIAGCAENSIYNSNVYNTTVRANGSEGYVGGIAGRLDNSSITNSKVNAVVMSSGNNIGKFVGYYFGSNGTILTSCTYDSSMTSPTNVIGSIGGSGNTSTTAASGTVSATDNFFGCTVVSTAAQLQTALNNNKNVVLSSDINLNGFNWQIVNGYSGKFNGNGHVISNLNISTSAQFAGLLGSVASGATLSNLGLENVTVSSSCTDYYEVYVGGLAGVVDGGSSIITNCYISNANLEFIGPGVAAIGGLVGASVSSIIDSNVYNANVLYLSGFRGMSGGLVGFVSSSLISNSNVYNSSASVSASVSASGSDESLSGGLAGVVNCSLINNSSVYNSSASVSGDIVGAGGLAGIAQGSLITGSNVYNATVRANGNAYFSGGLFGVINDSIITDSNVNASVLGSGSNVGKIIGTYYGDNQTILTSCTYDTSMTSPINVIGTVNGSGNTGTTATAGSVVSGLEYYSSTDSNTLNGNKLYSITNTTTLGQLGINSSKSFRVSGGSAITIGVNDSIVSKLQNAGMGVSISNGQLTITGDSSHYLTSMDSALSTALKINVGQGYTYDVTGAVTHSNTNSTQRNITNITTLSTANSSSLSMADLGLTSNGTISTNNYVITVNTTDMMSDVLTKFNNAGITASINDSNGTLQLIGSADNYITAASNNLRSLLGLTVGNGYTYNTNTITTRADSTSRIQQYNYTYTVQQTATENTYLRAFNSDTNSIAGNLVFSTDDGEKVINLTSDDTIKSLRKKLSSNGITSNFSDGKLTLSGNSGSVSMSGDSTSSLASLMGLNYESTLGNYSTSSNINKLADEKYEESVSNNTGEITIQAGIYGTENDIIKIDTSFKMGRGEFDALTAESALESMERLDSILKDISIKQTELAAASNRLDSVTESILTYIENLTSSRSTLRDADIAKESSNYIKSQILQQASATLLATANQSPSIALQLI